MTAKISKTDIQSWLTGEDRPVALHLSQPLTPVEGSNAVIFPPTYAPPENSGSKDNVYNIDELSDGTRIATIDSVGSQANRMEPMFSEGKYKKLVPQITIEYKAKDPGDEKGKPKEHSLSILKAGHRLGDAIVRCTELDSIVHDAFIKARDGDVSDLARLGPTSLIFGVWDSRDTQVRFPRIVQSVVRAKDISDLRRSVQFTPAINYKDAGVFNGKEYESKKGKDMLSERGYQHVPNTGLGGIIANGGIKRDVTINFLALTALPTGGNENELQLHSYLLGLALVAALRDPDYSLRSGCLLVRDPDLPAELNLIKRDGSKKQFKLDEEAKEIAYDFALEATEQFGKVKNWTVKFNDKKAEIDAKKKDKGDANA